MSAVPQPSELPLRIIRARDIVLGEIRVIVARSNLTEQQWRLLSALAEAGPMDATRLAKRSGLLLPSQTRILQTLEEKNLVVRRRDVGDRRRQLVQISDSGRDLVEAHAKEIADYAARIEDRLGKERLAELQKMLELIRDV